MPVLTANFAAVNERGIQLNGESDSPPAPSQTRPTVRILLVDDDASVLRVYGTMLRRSGFETETAADGAAAWEAIQAKGYDLLITDHDMPKVKGLDLVKKVRSARLTLPIILASGALPMEELYRNAWLQPVATLAKPFSGRMLLDTVTQVLARPANDSFREAGAQNSAPPIEASPKAGSATCAYVTSVRVQ